jgi:sacsin
MAKPFRQEESLAVRLKGILSEYPPGVSIFKELLQNADDAGAKIIVILPSSLI